MPNSLNAPIVGMVPSSTGHGYFMVASDGGVFAFGDAHFEGSCPGIGGCAGVAVSVMPDSTGNGYWLVTSPATSTPSVTRLSMVRPPSSVPVIDAVATPMGRVIGSSTPTVSSPTSATPAPLGARSATSNYYNPATAIFPTEDCLGYWVASARGDVFTYGSAPYLGVRRR